MGPLRNSLIARTESSHCPIGSDYLGSETHWYNLRVRT
jgi:hypothetical protein